MGGDVYDTNSMSRCQKLFFIHTYTILDYKYPYLKFLTPIHEVSVINITSHINFITYLYNF